MGLRPQYRVIVSEHLHELEQHINDYLEDGWECQGGISWYATWIEVPTGDGAKEIDGSFMQAIIKLEQ